MATVCALRLTPGLAAPGGKNPNIHGGRPIFPPKQNCINKHRTKREIIGFNGGPVYSLFCSIILREGKLRKTDGAYSGGKTAAETQGNPSVHHCTWGTL